jgi:hypothetical protein
MELANAIETLFGKMSVTDDMSLDDISGSFVQIHDELPSITRPRKSSSIKQSSEEGQALDQSRIKCLEYLFMQLPDRPNFFNIHAEDSQNSKFSRATLEILITFVKNMTPSSESQKQSYHGKAHLVGLVSLSLAKLLIVNIDLAYDTQLMGNYEENSTDSKQMGSAAKQKQFLSLCRKALSTIVGYASFEQERLSQIRDNKIIHDVSAAAGCFAAISELLTALSRRDIRFQSDQIESIRSIALKGILLSSHTHTPTMLTCGTIYATLCCFESAEKHAATVRTLCESLQLLVDQCYMLIPEEHDPRKLYLTDVDKSDVTRLETIARENRTMEFLSLMRRKKTMLDIQAKTKPYLSIEEYQLLFKSITHTLLRCITIAYTFPILIDAQKVLNLIRDAAMLDASIYVTNYRPLQKTISVVSQREDTTDQAPIIDTTRVCLLRADSFREIISVVHLNSLKCLSALILTCSTQLLPYAKSISIILVQDVKKWCISNDSSSKETCQVFRECIRAITCAIDEFGPCVSASLSQPLLPILYDQLSKFHHSCIRLLSTGDPLSSAESQLEDFSFTGKKKRRKKIKSTVNNENKRALVSFSNFAETTTLAVSLLKRIMSDTRVFVSTSREANEGETTIDVLSHTIDLTTVMISSITLWHEQHAQLKNSHYHTLTTPVIIDMYDALLWTLLSTSNVDTQSPFLPHVMDLLRRGARSHIPDMVSACSKALLVVDSFLHPRSAPIYIPPAESIHLHQLKKMEKEERESRLLNYKPTPVFNEDEDSEMNDKQEDTKESRVRKERNHEMELEQERVEKQAKVEQPVVVIRQVVTMSETVVAPQRDAKETNMVAPERENRNQAQQDVVVSESVHNLTVATLSNAEIEKAFEAKIETAREEDMKESADDDIDVVDEDGDDPLVSGNTDLDSLDLQF